MDKKKSKFSTSYYYSYFRLNKIVSVLILTVIVSILTFGYIVVKPFLTKGQSLMSNASLRLPDTTTATLNQNFTLPLALDTDSQNIYGTDVVMGFDRSKLQLIDIDPVATESTTLKQFLPMTSTNAFDKAKVIADANATGLIQFSAVTFDPGTQNVTNVYLGSTTLANLTFMPLVDGSTVLSIIEQAGSTTDSNIVFATNPPEDALQRTDQITDSSITINPSTLPSNTPTPSSVITPTLPPSQTPTPTIALNTPTPTAIVTLTPTMPMTPTPTVVSGQGLTGAYFNNKDLTGLVFTRIDPTINFNWGSGSPDASIGPDTFSIRWTGSILPQVSGTYTFSITSDDGVRLWINNNELINQWNDHSAKTFAGKISLIGGLLVPVKIEYYEDKGKALIQFYWAGPGFSKKIVPKAVLYP